MTTEIVQRLEEIGQDTLAYPFKIEPLPGEEKVYRVVVDGQPEFPIAMSEADGELLCMVRLFGTDEIAEGRRDDLFETMLAGNLTLPLSTFGLTDGAVYLFGSLSAASRTEVIVEEIQALAGNTVEALELVQDYLT
ncbi:MAG: DUF2170 family protein [Alphaproteobacteria bacterium]